MGKHKKRKKRLNILKFIRFILVLCIIAALIVGGIKYVPKLIKGEMKVGEIFADIGKIFGGGEIISDNPNDFDPDKQGNDPGGQAGSNPDEEPEQGGTNDPGFESQGSDDPGNPGNAGTAAWPNTTTTSDMYPLQTPDGDILVLVNKTHPMSKSYAADDLVTVEHCDQNVGNKDTKKMRKIAADAFEELYAGAQEAGYSILMRTGYRSYDYQKTLYNSYVSKNGEEKANTYSAKPGQSEHQTGLCCDVGRAGKGLTTFDGTDEAKWIEENAWKYGFILRFPEGKSDITGYIYESWHIRYVGKEAAKIIYENNWTLEEYLEKAAEKQ